MALWTDYETALLCQFYATATRQALVQMIGRPELVIRSKAQRMGLKKIRTAKDARNVRPIGSQRTDKYEGLLVRKVTNTGNPKKDWVRVDVIEWEAVHGPIPCGHTLMLVNANLPRTLDNLALFTKSQHFQRISMHNLPPEIAELYQLKAQINRAVSDLSKAQPAP